MNSHQLIETLRRINQERGQGNFKPFPMRETPISIIEKVNQAGRRLALYGSAGPLTTLLNGLSGVWEAGAVYGQLVDRGASAAGWQWDPDGPAIPVRLFKSDSLRDHWPALDDAAGADFVRLLVPVLIDNRTYITNIYALREPAAGEVA